jgi:hypothetical protein
MAQKGSKIKPKTISLKNDKQSTHPKSDKDSDKEKKEKKNKKVKQKPLSNNQNQNNLNPTDNQAQSNSQTNQPQNSNFSPSNSSVNSNSNPANTNNISASQPSAPTRTAQTKPANQNRFNSPFSSGSPFGSFSNPAASTTGGNASTGSNMNTPQQTPKRQTPQERVEMIKKVYDEVLGRPPDTRDINYYKYSTLNEQQIRNQILTSSEHKELLKKGREYENLKAQADQFKSRSKMLETQIKDQIEEFRQLNVLLKEKNRYITSLRQDIIQKQGNSSKSYIPQCIQSPQSNQQQQASQQQLGPPPAKSEALSDRPSSQSFEPEPQPINYRAEQEQHNTPETQESFDANSSDGSESRQEQEEPKQYQANQIDEVNQQYQPEHDNPPEAENYQDTPIEESHREPGPKQFPNHNDTTQTLTENQEPTQPPPPPDMNNQFGDDQSSTYSSSERSKGKSRIKQTLNSIFGDIF